MLERLCFIKNLNDCNHLLALTRVRAYGAAMLANFETRDAKPKPVVLYWKEEIIFFMYV